LITDILAQQVFIVLVPPFGKFITIAQQSSGQSAQGLVGSTIEEIVLKLSFRVISLFSLKLLANTLKLIKVIAKNPKIKFFIIN